MSFTPTEVLSMAASLNNDTAQESLTDVAVLPYLNMAMSDLQELFELNNVPITNETSAAIVVLAGATTVVLPADLVEVQQLFERDSGSDNSFTPMERREFLPKVPTLTNWLMWWQWVGNAINFVGANADREVKIDYIKSIFTTIAIGDVDVAIAIKGAKQFLGYRTASLCALFIGENETRAGALNELAVDALDRALGIPTKGRQSILTRRRPFRASWKNRGVS